VAVVEGMDALLLRSIFMLDGYDLGLRLSIGIKPIKSSAFLSRCNLAAV
jgi:hypothetical protein